MNIYKNDSIGFTTPEREKISSTSNPRSELNPASFLDASPFTLSKVMKNGMLSGLALIIEEQLTHSLKEKDDKIEALKTQIDQMEFLLMSEDFSPLSNAPIIFPTDLSKLQQNSPNPFCHKTTVECFVPSSAIDAALEVISQDGFKQKSIHFSQRGELAIELDSSGLMNGTYTYQLVADGKILHGKEMVVAK